MPYFSTAFYILSLIVGHSSFAQPNCNFNNLIGEWRQVKSIAGIHPNIDSLKHLAHASNKTIGKLEFRSDSTYYYHFLDGASKQTKRFSVDLTQCEIILGQKRRAKTKSNLEIIYMDSQILIFKEDNNPKGYITHLLVKT